jgi:hypothetical protein
MRSCWSSILSLLNRSMSYLPRYAQMLEVQEKAGFIPNVFLTFAYRPEEWRAMI